MKTKKFSYIAASICSLCLVGAATAATVALVPETQAEFTDVVEVSAATEETMLNRCDTAANYWLNGGWIYSPTLSTDLYTEGGSSLKLEMAERNYIVMYLRDYARGEVIPTDRKSVV